MREREVFWPQGVKLNSNRIVPMTIGNGFLGYGNRGECHRIRRHFAISAFDLPPVDEMDSTVGGNELASFAHIGHREPLP
jgi:hypothetical protein